MESGLLAQGPAPGQCLPLQAIFASKPGIGVDRGLPSPLSFDHPFSLYYSIAARGPRSACRVHDIGNYPLISHSISVVFLLSVRLSLCIWSASSVGFSWQKGFTFL